MELIKGVNPKTEEELEHLVELCKKHNLNFQSEEYHIPICGMIDEGSEYFNSGRICSCQGKVIIITKEERTDQSTHHTEFRRYYFCERE